MPTELETTLAELLKVLKDYFDPRKENAIRNNYATTQDIEILLRRYENEIILESIKSETKKGLTKRQKEVLKAIIDYEKDWGYYPSYRNLCIIMDISSTFGIKRHIDALEKKGYLEKPAHIARAFVIP